MRPPNTTKRKEQKINSFVDSDIAAMHTSINTQTRNNSSLISFILIFFLPNVPFLYVRLFSRFTLNLRTTLRIYLFLRQTPQLERMNHSSSRLHTNYSCFILNEGGEIIRTRTHYSQASQVSTLRFWPLNACNIYAL